MASKKTRSPRSTRETNPRKFKKKTSVLLTDKVVYVDYKNVDLLQRFVSDRAKIRNRRVTGNDVQQQREVANAIKVAREMALIPYAKRVSTQRTRPPRDGGDRYAARNAEAAEQVRQAAGASDVVDVVDVSDAAVDDVALEDEELS